MDMNIEDGGSGHADIPIAGPTDVRLIPQEDHMRLQIATKSDGKMSISVPLNATETRRLGEWVLAHSVFLEVCENG